MLVALFAPELLVYVAWCQWSSAKYLSTEVNRLIDEQSEASVLSFIQFDSTYAKGLLLQPNFREPTPLQMSLVQI
jgi:hypothetical protein